MFLGYPAGPISSGAEIDFRLAASRMLITFLNHLPEGFDMIGLNERDGAAAKTAARHSCSVNALGLLSEFNQ